MRFLREWTLFDWLLLAILIALIRWIQIEDRNRKYNPHTHHQTHTNKQRRHPK